jgi:hypothetical protein
MVIIPDSAAVADGLSFTVGQITWTTGVNSFTATTTEEAQIRFVSTTSLSATALTTLATTPTTPGNGSDHAANSSTTSPLQRKGDRQHRPDRSYRPSQPQALANPDFGGFDPKSIYQAGTS